MAATDASKPEGGGAHFPGKAKRMVVLWQGGGPSHVDLWDYKPGLEAMRFNAVSARRMMGREPPDRPVAAACKPTGYPVLAPLLALALVEFVRAGITDMDGLLRVMNTTQEQEADARTSIDACRNRFLPILKDAGVF